MITYKVLDPRVGMYTETATVEEATDVVAEFALGMFLAHTHGNPFSICSRDENGIETWYSVSNEPIPNDEMIREAIKAKVANSLTTIPVTPVEVLP